MVSTSNPLGLSRRSLADQVADALIQLILSESLQEGDTLPPTAELSERYGVSRTVVREALAALAGRGILTRSQGRESVIATPGAGELTSLLQFRIRHDEVSVESILDTRGPLEVMAAERAASHAGEADLAAIRTALDKLTAAKREADFHKADIALHRAIAVASGNPLIVLILDALVDFLRDVRVKATAARKARGESQEFVVQQHRAIVEAIEAGDVARAGQAMREHLELARSELAPATVT